jgi:exodeoxyribonuclease VII large subunit
MIDRTGPIATSTGYLQTLGVAALMEQVRWSVPQGTVMVKGVVGSLRPWPTNDPTVIYGDLRDTMSFRCPRGSSPLSPKELVVLQGTLKIKRSQQHSGFELHLIGEKIGNWILDDSMKDIVATPKSDRPKLPLERFVTSGLPKRIVFIGTERALKDAESTFRRFSQADFPTVQTVATFERLQSVMLAAAQGFDGLCFLRGGGDSTSFAIWNDSRLISLLLGLRKPFYTAIGHATDVTLADKYADESFVTPSDLGSAYSAALVARNKRESLERSLDEAIGKQHDLQIDKDAQLKLLAERENLATNKAKRNMRIIFALLGLLILAIIGLLIHI